MAADPKKHWQKAVFTACILSAAVSGCARSGSETESTAVEQPPSGSQNSSAEESEDVMNVRIRVGDRELSAKLNRNETTEALVEQMPMTLPMMNLYGREMCYRFGEGALPADHLRDDGYQVGDIAYWPPAGSLVILYAQNGEHFERVQIGHIDEDIDFFEELDQTDVTFELENQD